jgi:nicotinic acid mononucleotide adenylyltransferase
LHAYLVENRYIESLRDHDEKALPIFSRDVLQKLRTGDSSWESMVPPQVAQMIRERKLFGWKGTFPL